MGQTSQAATPSSRGRTLSASLRNRLILTVSVIFMITTLVNYWVSAHRSAVLNEEKTAEYLIYLKDNLEIPLWNMDRDWIQSICRSFANNEHIGVLKVTDGYGTVIFEKKDALDSGIDPRSAALHFRETHIGTIELGISPRVSQQRNDRMLLINILTMVLVLAGIAVSTRLVLDKILEKPLSHLLRKIGEISEGKYDGAGPRFDHFEIVAILDRFNLMAEKVGQRERSLMETNRQLALEISDRKQAEQAHAESRARYQQLVEDLTVGVFRSSAERDGPFVMVNQALADMLGYPDKAALLDHSVTRIYRSPDMRARFLDMLFRHGELQGFEHEFVRKDGSVMTALTTCHISRDPHGAPLYIDGIIEDITQRKLLETRTRQTQKMEALGTLAGGIAHDFNNILASILGFTEVVKLRAANGKELSGPLDEILSAGIRARSLIKQIMAFSRQSEVKKIPISITPIVKETIKFLRASLPAMIEIRFDLKAGDTTILGDPTQIHQILMNLCANAAHAMEAGGLLEITLDTVAATADTAPSQGPPDPSGEGEYLRLEIRDTGHGIRLEHMERIFEPFFTTKQRGEGTGMGLAVVHGIVADMGGQITARNRTQSPGTAFCIMIPAHGAQPLPLSRDTGAPGRAGWGRILFVEDEAGFLASGTEILTDHGFRVVQAGNGEEALALFKAGANDIDMVVTDMVMPGMTGLELARRVKAVGPEVPVVLCTGFGAGIDREAFREAGIRDVVMKPVLARELISAVERNLATREV